MNSELEDLLDLMRLVAQPDAVRSAHVTIQGPFKDEDAIIVTEETLCPHITINGPGQFHNCRSVIYLACDIGELQKLWNKPDFPNGTPHITIYEGDDKQFSTEIFKILSRFNWGIPAKTTSLVELEKKIPTSELKSYSIRDLSDAMEKWIGSISFSDVEQMHSKERLYVIFKLAQYLNEKYVVTGPS